MKKEVLNLELRTKKTLRGFNVERRTSNVEHNYRVLPYILINFHPNNAWHRPALVQSFVDG